MDHPPHSLLLLELLELLELHEDEEEEDQDVVVVEVVHVVSLAFADPLAVKLDVALAFTAARAVPLVGAELF
jgi:hypothetical protein